VKLAPVRALARKEWTESFNAPMPYIFLTVFFLLSGWFFVSSLFVMGQATLEQFFAPMPLLLAFFLPAFTMRLFAEEYKTGTIEVLATLPLRDEEIAAGKYAAALSFWASMLGLSLFYAGLLCLAGRPDLGQAAAGLLGTFLLGALYCSIGLFASALSRSQVVGFLLGFLFCFALFLSGKAAQYVGGPLGSALTFLGVDAHYEPFLRGVVDSRDVVYFLSGAALFWAGTLAAFHRAVRLEWRKDRVKRWGLTAGTGLALAAGIAALANLVSSAAFFRWDWTADDRYSLSEASVKLARSLQDPLLARLYLSPGLPQPYETQGRYVVDLLREYRGASKGMIALEIVDPDSSDRARSDAAEAGVEPARFTQLASDQFQVRQGYMGVVLHYQDKRETIPFVRDTAGLEYDVSSLIKQLAAPARPRIGFVTGHGETSPYELRGERGGAFESFETETVSLSTSAERSKASVLFVLGPRSPVPAEELAVLDSYVSEGVPTVVFLSRSVVNLGSFMPMAQVTGLEPFLEHYGARVEQDFVLDPQCQTITIQSNQGGFAIQNIVKYPAIPLSNRLDRENPVLRTLDVLGFPFAHPVAASGSGGPLKFTPLAESSPYSWRTPGITRLDPYELEGPAPDAPRGPFPLAALVEGSTTAYSDPAKAARVKLVVVGTSYFPDPGMPTPPGNRSFLSGLTEWLAQDPHFLAIPTREAPYRPLRELSGPAHAALKLLGFFFLPALVLAWGFLRWRRREARRAWIRGLAAQA
jgi:ABC-type transport system involved in multi-copper enzyme maturation permease subunit